MSKPNRRIDRMKRRTQFAVNVAFVLLLLFNVLQILGYSPTLGTGFTIYQDSGEDVVEDEIIEVKGGADGTCNLLQLYYDTDGDDYGGNVVIKTICEGEEMQPGFTLKSNDCDDANPTVWRLATVFEDRDGDGYSSNITKEVCTTNHAPKGYLAHRSLEFDCNDRSKLVNPGSEQREIAGGLDYNCNNKTDLPIGSIFVSSESYRGNLGGLDGADNKCKYLALKTNYLGDWIALLSSSKVNASERLPKTMFVNSYQIPIADNPSDLFKGWLSNEIKYDETGFQRSMKTWTGSNSEGLFTGSSCEDWLSSEPSVQGTTGSSRTSLSDWIDQRDTYCSQQNSLFCVRVT